MAFYQKYRPKVFADLIGEDHISETLREAVRSNKLSHAYLLCGPRGTGKTTTARLLAKALNCETIQKAREKGETNTGEPCNKCASCLEINEGKAIDVIEIDAASHTKVDEIREVIDKAIFAPARSSKKVYIIDEVHMLSNSSFNALLKTLEEPPNHVVFILATTEAHKLPATVLSRTQRHDFRRVVKDEIVKNLKNIASLEDIEIDNEALDLIALGAEGGHRDAVGLLEQVASVSKKIDHSLAANILGIAKSREVFDFLGAIFNNNPEEGLKIAHRLYDNGLSMSQFQKSVVETLRRILLYQISKQFMFEDTEENKESIENLAGMLPADRTVAIIEKFIKCGQLLKDIAYPILPIEMAVIESCGQLSISRESSVASHQSSIISHQNTTTIPKQATNHKPQNTNKSQNQNDQDKKPDASEDLSTSSPVDESARDDKEGKSSVNKVENIPAPTGPNVKEDESLRDEAGNSRSVKQGIKEAVDQADAVAENQKSSNESKEPTANTQPVAVFQMTNDLWQQVIDVAKKENASLAALLRDATPMEVSSDVVKLGVRFPFHREKISEEKNRMFLEKIIGSMMGGNCKLVCEIQSKKKPAELKKMTDDELHKAAEEIFT